MTEHHYYDEDELYDEGSGRTWSDDDPLVERLRTMTWAEAPADVRERCWQEIKKRVDELERQGLLGGPHNAEVNCDRYGFSRANQGCRMGPERGVASEHGGQRASRSPAWAFR